MNKEEDISGTKGLSYLLQELMGKTSRDDIVNYRINHKIIENKIYAILNSKIDDNEIKFLREHHEKALDNSYNSFLKNLRGIGGMHYVNEHKFFVIKTLAGQSKNEEIQHEGVEIMVQYTQIFTIKTSKTKEECKSTLMNFQDAFSDVIYAAKEIGNRHNEQIKIKIL